MFNERLIEIDWRGDLGKPGWPRHRRRTDEKTLEVTLREGVVFHNGDPMTAGRRRAVQPGRHVRRQPADGGRQDVAECLLVDCRPGLWDCAEIPPVARRLWPGLDRVEVVDKQTVRFVNAAPLSPDNGSLSA